MEKKEIICDKNIKLSDFLFGQGFKNSQVKKILKQKDVKVEGKREGENKTLLPGQKIEIYIKNMPADPSQKKYEIVYEDDNIFVINKKAGIEICGSDGLEGQLNGSIAVHRLDRDTKGLVVFAKNTKIEQALLSTFKNRNITKKYLCEVLGDTHFNGEVYKAFLLKNAKDSYVKIFDTYIKNSVEIYTKFNTIKHGYATSIVEVQLLTGKTHQIRAHLAYLGHPILGDNKYGNKEINKKYKEKTQKLMSYYLKFKKVEGFEYLDNKEFVVYPDWYKGNI